MALEVATRQQLVKRQQAEKIHVTIFKNSVPTAQTKYKFPLKSQTGWLILFIDIIAVYCENHMEYINTLCEQNTFDMIPQTEQTVEG
jgi:1,4-alpha-glucan branching enzyme